MSPLVDSPLEKILASYAYIASDQAKNSEKRIKLKNTTLGEKERGNLAPPPTPPLSRKRGNQALNDGTRVVDENRKDGLDISRTTKKIKKKRKKASGFEEKKNSKEVKGKTGKRSRKKKIVVVSPYFVSSAAKLVQHEEDGGGNSVEVVVQRRTRRKTTRVSIEDEVESSPFQLDCDRKKKKKNKQKNEGDPSQLTAAERMQDAYKRVPDDNMWVPPFSDHELLQEFHFFDHWRVLVICMLLNRTTGQQVRRILPRLFLLCPDAKTTETVPEEAIEDIIRPLGLQNKRSKMIKRMSQQYMTHEWTHVTQLHGIGKYAADAYAIFCSGRWMDVKPNDHKLVDYWRFLMDDKVSRQSISVVEKTSAEDIL
ncbi:DNA glycosylase superfamily protein [Wolffia australiana]